MGSDVVRDGMFMELLSSERVLLTEVFYSDVTNRMVVTLGRQALPIEVIETLLFQAEQASAACHADGLRPGQGAEACLGFRPCADLQGSAYTGPHKF